MGEEGEEADDNLAAGFEDAGEEGAEAAAEDIADTVEGTAAEMSTEGTAKTEGCREIQMQSSSEAGETTAEATPHMISRTKMETELHIAKPHMALVHTDKVEAEAKT